MSEPQVDPAWARLAELLVARRVELGYPKRLPFARNRGLSHDRTLSDLESQRRRNFDAATLAQVEQVYEWRPGSIAAVLAGGDPTPEDSETVSASGDDAGVLLDLPPDALADLTPLEREEAISAAKASLLERAREIRRRVDGG